MTDINKHTPLPWVTKLHESTSVYAGSRHIMSAGGYSDGEPATRAENEANTKFIERACSSHYELLEALEGCQNILAHLIDPQNKGSGISSMVAWARCVEAETKARAAISKARGQS